MKIKLIPLIRHVGIKPKFEWRNSWAPNLDVFPVNLGQTKKV